jgi:hypothetical protein
MVLGMAIGLAALVTSSIPLGLARWTEYAFTTRQYARVVRDMTPPVKQLTLYAFWRTVPTFGPRAALAAWTTSAAGLLVLAGLAMYRTDARGADGRARVVGLAILLAVCCNFYAYFYDGLLLTVPGVVWYVTRGRYRAATRVAIAACIATAFVVSYVQFIKGFSGISWVGAVIALWAAFEACDLLARRALPAVAQDVVTQPAAGVAS